MMKHVYLKEMKDSFRDRKTIFLSIIIPILFNIGIVFFMDQILLVDQLDEKIDVSINEQADPEVISWLKSVEQLHIIEVEDPLAHVKSGDSLIPFEVDSAFPHLIKEEQSPEITLYAEPTSPKASSAMDTVSAMLTLKKNELTSERLIEEDVSTFFFKVSMAETVSMADRKSTRLNSSHVAISYAVFCLTQKNINQT